jgi:hypothetical protein
MDKQQLLDQHKALTTQTEEHKINHLKCLGALELLTAQINLKIEAEKEAAKELEEKKEDKPTDAKKKGK